MFYSPYGVGLWLATGAFAILALTLGVSAFVADFAKTRERASSVGPRRGVTGSGRVAKPFSSPARGR
jgi:hypothetical protein